MTIEPQVIAAILGGVSAIVAAGIKGVWVFGSVVERVDRQLVEMTTDRNFWRDIALAGMRHTDQALSVAEKQAPGA